MKVKELIERLKKVPGDQEVFINTRDYGEIIDVQSIEEQGDMPYSESWFPVLDDKPITVITGNWYYDGNHVFLRPQIRADVKAIINKDMENKEDTHMVSDLFRTIK